jgi:hypothetical protein
VKFLR